MEMETKNQIKQSIGWALAALVMMVGLSPASRYLSAVPETIQLTEGSSTVLSMPLPIKAAIPDGSACAISDMAQTLADVDPAYILTGEAEGNSRLVLSLMGLPVKTLKVSVSKERTVIPGGQSIGVALTVGGALVVGTSDVGGVHSPARDAGLRSGDRITQVDGIDVENAVQLSELLTGDTQLLSIVRDGKNQLLTCKAAKDTKGGGYKLGAWVRDSTAGVGTLSFYDPDSGVFGALGHAITDVDTGTVLPVSEGYIYESQIVGLMRGQSGEPGELLGEFFSEEKQIGSVEVNGELGLYGLSDSPMLNELYPAGVKLMQRSQVKTGPAKLITTIEGKGMCEYDCEIVKLYHQDSASPRSMVVRITDEALLKATGGIIQGMSGSPIIQDGMLAGAVTHVFINDPTQGYGLYAEWMLDEGLAA